MHGTRISIYIGYWTLNIYYYNEISEMGDAAYGEYDVVSECETWNPATTTA